MKISNCLADSINIRSSNLSLIRFLSAVSVIICHAYPLSLGSDFVDPLSKLSNGTLSFGNLAVAVFFISSGLLVFKSIERKNGTYDYFKARCLKIFPSLILTIILSILLLGLFFSDIRVYDFFTSKDTYIYLLNCFLIPVHNLPGVFTNNVYGQVVNGALWTLPVEFLCYIGLFVMYRLSLLRKSFLKYTILPITIMYVLINVVNIPILTILRAYGQPIFIFYVGMLFYAYKDKIRLRFDFFIVCLFGFIISVIGGFAWFGLYMFFPYLIIYLSFGINQLNSIVNKLGNISYGIYLCAFPIQQCLVSINGGQMTPWTNATISVCLSVLIGIMIYYVSEYQFHKLVIKKL